MTWKELLQLVYERYDRELTDCWVNIFIGHYLDALKTCRSLPQDDRRLTIPRAQLEDYIQTMHVHLACKFFELVFNLGELGYVD
jgi:hypothetical protein